MLDQPVLFIKIISIIIVLVAATAYPGIAGHVFWKSAGCLAAC
jgi:hypothetical protein